MVDRMYIGPPARRRHNALGVGVTFPVIIGDFRLCRPGKHGRRSQGHLSCWARAGRTKQKTSWATVPLPFITVAVVLTAFFLIFGRRILLMFSQRQYHRVRVGLHADLFPGNHFCTAGPWTQRLYQCPGICQDRYVHRAHQAICNIILDPILMFCVSHGRSGALPHYHHIPGNLRCMGCPVPDIE